MSVKSSEHDVLFAEHEMLKDKYETLRTEHETLMKTHIYTLNDLAKKQREALVAKEDVEKWENKFGELQTKLEKVENEIQDLMTLDETQMNGVDSVCAAVAENLNVNSNNVPNNVIEISDDDGGNQSESDRGHSNTEYSFYI
ncbi:unnamed protein product [Thlaspi arvense]|uniref:Uncharacterized protein n=1 Tax=Thlaspi arvense TaxID=13288 RepID=A0AAU9T591_THLAR|nr:unnamed protein product [Thlaspi arvense]